MAGVWVFAEQRDGKFRQVVYEMLGEGRKLARHLDEPLVAVVFGDSVASLAQPLAEQGADRVLVVEDALLAQYTTDGWSRPLTRLARDERPSAILFAHSSIGRDLAPVVAQGLDAGQLSDIVEVSYGETLRFRRPVYAGKAFAWMEFAPGERTMVVTVRPKAFEAQARQTGRSAEVRQVAAELTPADIRQRIAEVRRKASGRVDLTEADYVVSGGRGLKSRENFKLLEELADYLGGAVGASRAAVDEGYRDSQFQVGQTGKVVSPLLYIACGLSGAIQHLAGMNSSRVIVAINKDPEAEIFNVADYGIVADLFEVVPALTEEIRQLKQDAA